MTHGGCSGLFCSGAFLVVACVGNAAHWGWTRAYFLRFSSWQCTCRWRSEVQTWRKKTQNENHWFKEKDASHRNAVMNEGLPLCSLAHRLGILWPPEQWSPRPRVNAAVPQEKWRCPKTSGFVQSSLQCRLWNINQHRISIWSGLW